MNPDLKAQLIAAALLQLIHWAPTIAVGILAMATPLIAAAFSWLREHTKNSTLTKLYGILEGALNAAMGAAMDRAKEINADPKMSDEDKFEALKRLKIDVIDAGMAAIKPHLPSWLTPAMLAEFRAYASNFIERILPMVKRDFSSGASSNLVAAPVSNSGPSISISQIPAQ